MRRLNIVGTVLVVTGIGCGAGDGDAKAEATAESPLTSEQPSGVAEVVSRLYLSDPEVLSASFSTPGVEGCSATMLGPNLLMTAAHCGALPKTAMFRTYRSASHTTSDTESFACRVLVQTFTRSDMMLMFCDPNARGENPGDKYGYLDLDTSAPFVGQDVYSVWRNPIDSLALSEARIYSKGKVQAIAGAGWFAPTNNALTSNVWGQPGASGSSLINPANGRVIGGPTSTAAGDFRTRNQLSIRDYLKVATVENRFDSTPSLGASVNLAEVKNHRLDPMSLVGGLDKDGNGLFDVQEGVERNRGENRRDHYFLGFESERRNALWNVYAGASIDAKGRTARIRTDGAAVVMSHAKLNLKPNTAYRVSLMSNTTWAKPGANLEVRFIGQSNVLDVDGSLPSVIRDRATIVDQEGAPHRTHAFILTTGPEPTHELSLATTGPIESSVVAISIIERTSWMNFDSHDKRANWRNENNGKRAFILPDGITTGTPNWAGLVYRDTSYARGNDFPLRNGQLGLAEHRWNYVCFSHKQRSGATSSEAWGVNRVLAGGSEVSRTRFVPGASWQQVCSSWFWVGSGGTNVMFGTDVDARDAAYLVDNVYVGVYQP